MLINQFGSFGGFEKIIQHCNLYEYLNFSVISFLGNIHFSCNGYFGELLVRRELEKDSGFDLRTSIKYDFKL